LTSTEVINPAIGLVSGLWYYKETSPITMSDNTFKNITISALNDVEGKANVLYGWEWSNNLTGVVESNNTIENLTNNLRYNIVYDSAVHGGLYEFLPTLTAGTTLIIPEGVYKTTGTLIVAADVTIKGEEGKEVVFRQESAAQDDVFNCMGDATFVNLTIETNRKGYAIADTTKDHDSASNITVIGCKFKGIASEKNYGIYKSLYGNLTVEDCTFDTYNNAICGVNNANGTETVITGCTFTNINGEAIGYVAASVASDFEANVIANNSGLTADNVIGY
jgi:hypothetical protein